MPDLALWFLHLLFARQPAALPSDVLEMHTNHIKFPVQYSEEQRGRIKQIHLYFSEDGGVTWHKSLSVFPTEEWLIHKAPRDGIVWFSLRLEMQDGKFDPPEPKNFMHTQKVFFNIAKREVPRLRAP